MSTSGEILIKTESLKNIMVARATGGMPSDQDYSTLRRELLSEPLVKDRMPRCVRTNRTLDEFWGFIKYEYSHYHERRKFLQEQFDDILSFLERGVTSPVEEHEALTRVDLPHIRDAWQKALDRIHAGDLDGAITASRTLVETVCKHILDDAGIAYKDDADLPNLYKLTAEHLNLAPTQHTKKVFRQILGGCTAAVEGLGAIRNRLSDAHGRGRAAVKPAVRHAELAVNLAGTMSTFLVATWESKKPRANS